MKLWKSLIICLPILFFALVSQANAQACGKYYVKITVQNENGKPVENADVKLLPIKKDETRGKNFVRDNANLSLFSIDYPEGYSFSSFHNLIISAEGFKPAENKITFSSCQNREVVVKLARSNSAQSAVWQFENSVNIQVVGDGKYLDDVKLTISASEKESEVIDMKFGSAYFRLPNGEYNFRFEKLGYQTKDVKVDLTPVSGKYLKVELTTISKVIYKL